MRHHKQYAIKFKVFLKFSDMRHDQVLNSFIFFPFSTVSLFFPLPGFFLSGFDILDIFSGFDISQVDYCGRLRQLIVNILRWLSRWWCCWWLWRLPSGLPTYELPTGRQSWGRQFWYHQSSGLPTLIMTQFFFNVFCWILLDWVLGMFKSWIQQ